MKNKAYFITQLCELKKISLDSEEAKKMEEMKIVDLLIAIKEQKPAPSMVVPPPEEEEDESDDDRPPSRHAGCRF